MERYHYKECGLDNVWLINGVEFVETPEGQGVSIRNIRQLNKAIGFAVADFARTLKPQEFRFLRTEMDLSQARVAEILAVDAQTVGRWERGENPIHGSADALIRLYYKDYFNGHPSVKEFIDRMAELDKDVDEEVNLQQTSEGWKRAA